METESEQNSNSTNGSSGSGGSSRPQIAQMSLYERQAVQALQALQRQPNAAQYFHQFMLQQQLSNAQLHSLAAVQQATIAASRQASSPNTSTAQQQTTTTQASINLATTSAAQLISRSQSVSSPSATTLTQSVLLGNTTSPPLNQSQAQMYLRVNRTLGRNVPLASQLILMPNGAVAAVQQEAPSAQSPGVHTDADQVQNLAVRNQQASAQGPQMQGSAQKAIPPGASPVSSLSQASSQALAVAQASSGASGQSLNLSQAGGGSGTSIPGSMGPGGGGQAPGGLGQLPSSGMGGGGSCPRKGTGVVQPLPAAQAVTVSQGSQTEAESAAAKKAEADGTGQQNVGMNLTRTATPAPSQTLISSATYTQIQPHSLIQQQQQIHLQQKQVVIQQQIAIHHQQQFPHRQSQLLHTATHLQLAQQQQQQQQQLCAPPAPAAPGEPTPTPPPANGNPLLPFPGPPVRPNVKNRLLVKNQDAAVANVPPKTSGFVPSGAHTQYPGQQMKPLRHLRQARTIPQSPAQHKALQAKPADAEGPPPPSQAARAASLQGRPPEAKPGAKRTVMHRASSGGGDGPHVSSKVRVIKLSGGGGESDGFFHPEGQPQRIPQPPEVRQQPARKVTLTKGALQQPQHPALGAHMHAAGPPGIKSIQGIHPAKKVLVHGRGRGLAGAMGRGRLMPNKQNLRVVECKPQPCVVSVEGLSSSTTDAQLKSLLTSVGPIQSLQMLPQQRKAIAKFKEPAHALAFQQKFHRHMIDLSHINVALIVE